MTLTEYNMQYPNTPPNPAQQQLPDVDPNHVSRSTTYLQPIQPKSEILSSAILSQLVRQFLHMINYIFVLLDMHQSPLHALHHCPYLWITLLARCRVQQRVRQLVSRTDSLLLIEISISPQDSREETQEKKKNGKGQGKTVGKEDLQTPSPTPPSH